MRQNALDQSNCRVFKSAISLEQYNEKPDFLNVDRVIEIKNWLKNIRVCMVKNRCVHSGHRTLKLVVSQEEISRMHWFSVCWYKFRKVKSYFNNFWVVMVKNGRDLLGQETLECLLHADSDQIIFGLTVNCSASLTFAECPQ